MIPDLDQNLYLEGTETENPLDLQGSVFWQQTNSRARGLSCRFSNIGQIQSKSPSLSLPRVGIESAQYDEPQPHLKPMHLRAGTSILSRNSLADASPNQIFQSQQRHVTK